MKKNKMIQLGFAKMVKKVVSMDANATCGYIAHQPVMPKSAKKLRKF